MTILKTIGYSVLATVAALVLVCLYDYSVKLYYLIILLFSFPFLMNFLCKFYYGLSLSDIFKRGFEKLRTFTENIIDDIEDEEEILA